MTSDSPSSWRRSACLLALLASLVQPLAAAAAASATPLPTHRLLNLAPPASFASGYAQGLSLNDQGLVVGHVNSASFPVAAVWQPAANGAVRVVGQTSPMPGSRNGIAAVNNAGVMVGGYAGPSGSVAMVDSGSGWRQLPWPDLRYTCCGQVDDINDAGVAVGSFYPTGLSAPVRFTPDGAGGYRTDALGSSVGNAVAINAGGQIAGTVLANGNSGPSQAVLWQPDKTRTLLGVLDAVANTSRATALNDGATVVGWSSNASNLRQGFVWSAGVLQAIPGLPGWQGAAPGVWVSNPRAIDNAGTIVGHAATASGAQHGFVMVAGGAPVDLLSLVAPDDPFFSLPGVATNHGLQFIDALDINEAGQILALGTYRAVGAGNAVSQVTQAFVLTPVAAPVPEPATALLWLLGLAAVGTAGARRRAVTAPACDTGS